MKRRDFLKLLGLTSGGAIVSSCNLDNTTKRIIPYLVPPEDEVLPGEPVYYHTTCTECPAHCGIEVKTRDGFPVKLEGIHEHPLNYGKLCIRGQASISRLYDPGRIKTPLQKDSTGKFVPVTWDTALSKIVSELNKSRSSGWENYYLTGRTTGVLSGLIDMFCASCSVSRLRGFETYSHASIRAANDLVFNRPDIPLYRIDRSDCLYTVGADICETFINPVRNTLLLSLAKYRGCEWTHFEPHLSLTGLSADERITMNPGSEYHFLLYILNRCLTKQGLGRTFPEEIQRLVPDIPIQEICTATGLEPDVLIGVAHRFVSASLPLLITGNVSLAHSAGLETAVIAALIHWVTGMTDKLIDFDNRYNYDSAGTLLDMEKFCDRVRNKGDTGVVFMSRTDPVSHYPEQKNIRETLDSVKLLVGLTDFMNPSMEHCDLILPLSHSLESWGDTEPVAGLRTVIQPVISPLHDTDSEGDILLRIMSKLTGDTSHTRFQDYCFHQWNKEMLAVDVERFIDMGYFQDSVSSQRVTLNKPGIVKFLQELKQPAPLYKPVLMIVPSIRSFDGRSAHLSLLSEIPDPLTTISYGAWISIPPDTAGRYDLSDTDNFTIVTSAGTASLPAKIQPGLPNDIYCMNHESAKLSVFGIDRRTGEGFRYLEKVQGQKSGSSTTLPILSGSPSLQGRGFIPRPVHKNTHHQYHEKMSLYPEHEHENYLWGMVIDLDRCNGCSACVAACYIENNIPVVGTDQHIKGREMSWLRIEPQYDSGTRVIFRPMMCQQCEYAPCEPVCPVYATYHNPEGLNAQIYNRCVGTRYCSNNCPYKVRRFNWFSYNRPDPLPKMMNPDISVRGKGVMEKCTFCVQRIRKAHDTAKDETRNIHDGEIVPACAQTCPSQAITFGNLLDKRSRVYRLAHSNNVYRVFEQLGTEPCVYYLKKPETHNTI